MSDDNGELWLPVAEACKSAGVPVRTGYRWVKSGRVPSREIAGTTKVRASDLERVSTCGR
jgi:hypothetical protein